MMDYQIKMLGPSGRVADVYVLAAPSDECAITHARILTQAHPELAGAEVSENNRVIAVEIKGISFIH
jgi:hypothetical protein